MSVEQSDVADELPGLHFPDGLYQIEAVKRAAYRFSDRVVVEIDAAGDGIRCSFKPLAPMSGEDLERLQHDFAIEALDQDLRASIAHETEQFRNLILSIAFSKTGLQG